MSTKVMYADAIHVYADAIHVYADAIHVYTDNLFSSQHCKHLNLKLASMVWEIIKKIKSHTYFPNYNIEL